MFQISLAPLIGIIAGICSGVFGIGGGIIIIPMLLFILKMSSTEAIATSLIALLLPVGSLGVYKYYQAGFIHSSNVKTGLLISVGMIAGTYFGARLASGMDGRTLSKSFAVFLFLVSLKIWHG